MQKDGSNTLYSCFWSNRKKIGGINDGGPMAQWLSFSKARK